MKFDHDAWEPFTFSEAVDLFAGAPFRWWISGGHALEIHMGATWRSHLDLDIGIVRVQAAAVRDWLVGWDLWVAAGGSLAPWDGSPLSAERDENNVWARRSPSDPWSFDLTVGEGSDDGWGYRRDPSLVIPWDQAVLRSPDGVPYLAPELQLLFKSKNPRPKDDLDAERVIPRLDAGARRLLEGRLEADHPWRELLDDVA